MKKDTGLKNLVKKLEKKGIVLHMTPNLLWKSLGEGWKCPGKFLNNLELELVIRWLPWKTEIEIC